MQSIFNYFFPQYPLEVVNEYNLESYLGDWFEVASSPIVHYTFERFGYGVRARYAVKENGQLSVYNIERYKAPNGPIKSIEGYAYIPDQNQPGKLRVHLIGAPVQGADYWILRLGPIVDGKYSWAIVSEPRKLFMWVLARDVQKYREQYEEQVRQIVTQELGFTGWLNKYVPQSFEGVVPYDD